MPDRLTHRAQRRAALVVSAALVALGVVAIAPRATAETIGFRDFSYGTSVTAPTGQKPQAKLWFNDGQWWGSLFNTATTDFEIHRYDWASHTWTSTGIMIDERQSSYMDVLWDGTKLYVATAGATESNAGHQGRLVRFSYDAASKTYSRDAGFPVNITNAGVKALVLAKDSVGQLWATYTQANRVWYLHSTSSDAAWATPSVLPVGAAANIGADELSAVVAYDGNRIGIMWSNQTTATMYWASHQDGAPENEWTLQAAYQRPEGADDHINLKSLQSDNSGRVFAAVKTSLNGASDPLVHLLVLTPSGTWTSSTFGTVSDQHTRAIVAIDEQQRQVYMFASSPCCSGGVIYMKQASLDNIAFPTGRGTPFISSDLDLKINNPTSTKQNVSSRTGLIVMASDDGTRRYVHNRLTLGGDPTTTTSSTATTSSTTTTTAPPTTTTTTVAAPDTTITSGPSGTATVSSATFTYTSSAADASFQCSLDGATFTACGASGASYGGLSEGTHTFAVQSASGGVVDPSPASRSWIVDTVPAEVFLRDDFTTGLANWRKVTGGDGQVTSDPSAADPDARFVATANKNSLAALRHDLTAPEDRLVVEATARFSVEGSTGAVPVFRLFDASGARLLTVLRRSGSTRGQLQVSYGSTTLNTSGALPLGGAETKVRFEVERASNGVTTLKLLVGGALVHTSSTATLAAPVSVVQLGSDSRRQAFDATFDDVLLGEPT